MQLVEKVLPPSTRQLDVTAHGQGCAVLQLTRNYNVPVTSVASESHSSNAKLELDIYVRAKHHECTHYTDRQLIMCFKFTPGAKHRSKSNMLIVKLGMVTGYWPNPDSLRDSVEHGKVVGIKKYEIIDESIFFYVDGVGPEHICITLLLQPLTDVASAEPGLIHVYDYYEPRLSAQGFYSIKCRDETWPDIGAGDVHQHCVAWERGYCTKYCMDLLHNSRFTCTNSLIVHGTPRNFCDYYESFSTESDNMNANCANGYCVATSEYYRCVCDEGFIPDKYGMECVKEGAKSPAHKYDACKNEIPCQGAKCITLVGGVKSYWCECLRGYTRQSHKVCKDIDECFESAPCGELMCVNTVGSYLCICPTGYDKGYTEDEVLHCTDVDECELDACSLYHCENYSGGYSCECPPNSQWNHISNQCDIVTEDECNRQLSNPCGDMTGKCMPIGNTDYKCMCIDGYFGDKDCTHMCHKENICGSGSKAGICAEVPGGYECFCTGESE